MNRSKQNRPVMTCGQFSTVEPLESRAYLSVDLTATISLTIPRSGQVKTGSNVAMVVDVINNGTTTASGRLGLDVGISLNTSGSPSISLGSSSPVIHIKADGHQTFHFLERVSIGTQMGEYFAVASVDSAHVFGVGGFIVSENAIEVVPKYPNLVGTFSGSGLIKTGTGKGLTYSISATVSTEDPSNGSYSFTGTNSFTGGSTITFAGTGKVSMSGAITESGADTPLDSSGVFHTVGKIIGNTFTFTWRNKTATGSGILVLQDG